VRTQGSPAEIQTDQPQRDLFAQQYSSGTFFSLGCSFPQEEFCRVFKNVFFFSGFYCLKIA
jgi:hypothetical protein